MSKPNVDAVVPWSKKADHTTPISVDSPLQMVQCYLSSELSKWYGQQSAFVPCFRCNDPVEC
eukprot:3694796-Prorocentrum_lima.AAC.1